MSLWRTAACAALLTLATLGGAGCSDDDDAAPDTTAPEAAVLAAGNPTPTSISVTWNAPGDDGGSGVAASYDLRYATEEITADNWSAAFMATGEGDPGAPGAAESVLVNGLAPATTYWFALRTADDAGNLSALSNSPSATTGVSANVTACLSCHGQPSLAKTVTIPGRSSEIVPLYVDIEAYRASVHGSLECGQCHTDIVMNGGMHDGVAKRYGGWARYSVSQAVDMDQTIASGQEDTRNYYTAASMSCSQTGCHADHDGYADSAHHTIYKLRESSVRQVAGHAVGEDYVVGNCNRCHASCATCHFGSTISRKDMSADDINNHWEEIQANGDAGVANASALTEWAMDWTTNVRSHEFRRASAFATSSDVCRSCHIGYLKPTTWGFYEAGGAPDSLRASGVKRHPQYQELNLPQSAHSDFQCAECHTDVHSYPGEHFIWADDGDAQCRNCHTPHYLNHETVACIGCHTSGLARDVGQTDGHNVWIDPVTQQVRPVIVKYSEPLTWYTHSWASEPLSCVTKCHYADNRVGAPPFSGAEPYAAGPPVPTVLQRVPGSD